MLRLFQLLSLFAFILFSCKKQEEVLYSGNEIAPYNGVSTILVENYVNRLFIDLIGREPTDDEMEGEVAALRQGGLSISSRASLVNKLMFGSNSPIGGGSYTASYFRKFYDDQKGRYLEGASEASIDEIFYTLMAVAQLDSLNGNMLGYELTMLEANKMKAVKDSREELQLGTIKVDEMCRRMMFNNLYDEINMNTFNFINASFDNTYFRYPTDAELTSCFNPIESNQSGVLFGQAISNKQEYLQVLTANAEFAEGMIRWVYKALLSREATSPEVFNLLDEFNNGNNTQEVQKHILTGDEYAGFNE
ncbi:MAG: hypothetical protein IT223_01730 [Crocinitomicaceae bacterium]|nr:hypothetical protein [Crocinitomicaceae bacterium]